MTCTHMQPATVRRRAPRPSAHMRCRPAALQRSAGLGALSRRGAHGRGPPAPALRCHGCGRACRQSLPVPRSPLTRGTKAAAPCAVAGGALCSAQALRLTAASRTSDSAHTACAGRPAQPPHARAGGWPSAPRCPRPPSARMASWRRPPRTCSACARAGRPRWPARATVTWRASRARCGARAAAPPLAPAQGRNLHRTGDQAIRTLQALSAL